MNASNYYDRYEDAIDEPLYAKFSKVFEDKSLYKLNKKIKEFEAARPQLTLVSFGDFTRTVPVTGKYLFSDGSQRYYELLYEFKIHKEIRYYEPRHDLVEWLSRVDEFAEWKKEMRFSGKNQALDG